MCDGVTGGQMQQEAELGRELFGYRKDDVDILLAELYRSMRAVKKENERLNSELADAIDKLSTYEDFFKLIPPAVTELKTTPNSDKLIKENLPGLIDIHGVESILVFDREGNILSALDHPETDTKGIKAVLASLDRWIGHLAPKLGGEQARLVFIEFEDSILILNPFTDGMSLGVIASISTAVGDIFKSLDNYVPNLKNALESYEK